MNSFTFRRVVLTTRLCSTGLEHWWEKSARFEFLFPNEGGHAITLVPHLLSKVASVSEIRHILPDRSLDI